LIDYKHSRGQAGAVGWFSNSTSITRSLAAISVLTSEFVTAKYGQTVIAIELVNEAFPTTKEQIATLEQFYRDGYEEVRKFGDQPVVLLSEAYQSLGFWSGFMPQPQYNKVALDVVSRSVRSLVAMLMSLIDTFQHIYGMFVPLKIAVSQMS
jgi:glucan 1,3-beta-glucosidase